ncbi:Mediator of RNA polymerase II transcription subunit 14 [Lamellibrachia satsuma]|nr:Mediator of RNA polymerase II transcription subunit 14 [Lamellibrachia satsuma]
MGLSKIVSQPLASFSIVPQSPVHIRLIFRNLYCIDIHCHRGNEVTLRDGAYSMFDTSKVVEGLNPTQGLKAFLNMYVDETMSSSQTRHQSTTEDDNPPSPFGMDTLDSLLSQPLSNSPSTARSKQDGGLRFQNPMTPPSNPHTPASPSTQRHGQTHSSPAAASFPLASPPSMTHGIAPSPSNIMAPSPNNPTLHVPSPSAFVPAPSPQSLGIHMPSPVTQFISPQGMLEGVGSPFASGSATLAMPSPGVRNWPASPSMPGPSPVSRPGGMLSPAHTAMHSPQTQLKDDYQKGSLSMLPSRMLPQRSWAGSIPTVLSHDALNRLLSPSYPPISGSTITVIRCCPLERFLCCMYLRRYLQRTIQSEDSLQMMQCNEPGVLMFKTDQLQFRISLNPNTLQSLHLTVTPTPEYQNHWELDELQVLERFFEFKVVSPPYKINTLVTFSSRVLSTPPNILKDFIKIMKMELLPDRNLKWSIQWCLTVPIGMSYPVGASAITVNNTKILFMVQLTRIGVAVPPGVESQNIVIPILYDHTMNTTQMLEQRPSEPTQANLAVSNMLKRFAEFNPNPNGCSIFPAMRELLTNLVVPMPGMNQPQ